MSDDDDDGDRRKKDDRNRKKSVHTYIYTAQLYTRKKKVGIRSRKKKRKKNLRHLFSALQCALGFGKEDEEIREKKRHETECDTKKKNSNILLRVQFGNLRSHN